MLEDLSELDYLEIQDLINQQNYLLDLLQSEQPDYIKQEIEYELQNIQDQINILI